MTLKTRGLEAQSHLTALPQEAVPTSLLYSCRDTVQSVLANVTAAKMPPHGQAVPHANSKAKSGLPEQHRKSEQQEEARVSSLMVKNRISGFRFY